MPYYPSMDSVLSDLINDTSLVKVQDEEGNFLQYIPGSGWMNTIGNVQLTKGYYLKANANTSITLTEPTFKTTTKLSKNIPPEYFSPVQGRLVYNPMNLVIKLENTGNNLFTEGDELAVFDGGFCVGAVVITNDKDYVTIVASMRDNPDLINGYNPGNNLKFKFWNHETNELYVGITPQNQNNIDVFTPLETYVGMLSSNALGVNDKILVDGLLKVIIAPNPVADKAKLYYYLDQNADVNIQVFDIKGKIVAGFGSVNQNKGTHAKVINMESFQKGVYILKVEALLENREMVIKKIKLVKTK
jgi:hypothetical protein